MKAPPTESTSRLAIPVGVALAIACASCDGYQPPCSVVPMTTAVSEPPAPGDFEADFALFASEQREIVATWLRYRAAQTTNQLPPPILPVAAEVAVVALTGPATQRTTIPLFQGLDVDAVPTDNVGFVWTRDGIVAYWTQDRVTGAEGEEPHIRTQLVMQRISIDGTPEPTVVPINVGCVDCLIRLSGVHADGRVLLLLTQYEETAAAYRSGQVHAVSWSLATGEITSGPIPWLLEQAPTSFPPRLRVDRENVLLATANQLWIVDTAATPLAGPFPLPPASNYAFAWSSEQSRAAVVWTKYATDPHATQPVDDVFFQLLSGHAEPAGPVERLTAAESVVTAAINEGRAGVIVRDRGEDYFVLRGEDGSKIGGDVELGPSSAVGTSASFTLLRPLGPDRYVRASGVPRRIERQEIICGE